MKCLFCGAEVQIGHQCEYCGSFAEPSYYPKAKVRQKAKAIMFKDFGSDFDEYVVARGDCLWNIAKRYYGTAVLINNKQIMNLCRMIADFNGIEDMNLIYPGQRIKLPKGKVMT